MTRRQWQGWRADEQPQQHCLVEPRALAGGGDIRHISEFLRASGWRDKSKAGGPLAMESPDRAVRVSYNPYVQPGGWAIHGAASRQQEQWWAVLGQHTPVEIVAGLTDTLTRPPSAHAANVWAPLQAQNWRAQRDAGHVTAISPNGSAWMRYHQSPDSEAIWWSGAQDEQGNGWSAQFASTTPLHLVQAHSTALSSPEPVMRPRGRVPRSALITTTSVSVLPSELGAWQQARITTARAATWARHTARSARPHSGDPRGRTRG